MEALRIDGTKQTPQINFNGATGVLEISGRSIPENSFDFYNPILLWLDDYGSKTQPKTVMQVKLEYFNTSSSKYILEVLKKIKSMHENGADVLVEWYHDPDDEEMMETGEDYKDVTDLPFEIIPID
jgi:hypothetical protein